jgi:hypothetical protein
MKRVLTGIAVMMLLLAAIAGCHKAEVAQPDAFDGVPLETILANVYSEADIELPLRGTTVITGGNAAYYLGSDEIAFSEAIASEAMINVIPFSLCLVRVADKAEAEATAMALQESANPNKWNSVSVNDDCVITDYAGDVVILIMAEEAEALHAAFLRLAAAESGHDLQTR